jgi:oligopeptide/dipeptide ABC transporter ATP-binding protein
MSAPPLLEVHGLVKHFVTKRSLLGAPIEIVRAVDGVSFDVRAGETLAIVGESGCGKSTVGRLVLRLIEPTKGTVAFEGRDVASLAAAALDRFRAAAQLVFQDPYGSLNPRMTIGTTLAEPLMLHTRLNAGDRKARVGELLSIVGLRAEHAQRYPHEFSGGQRQRIAIARALAVEPKLIVCDEPVSALDVSIRAQVLNLLKDLQQRLGLAYIFISHDLGVVKHVANRVAVMYLGRIVETAATADVFARPRHPYTQALLSAIPLPDPGAERTRRLLPGDPPSPIAPPAGCHLHPRCAFAVANCKTDAPPLEGDAKHRVACHYWRTITGETALPRARTTDARLDKLLAAFERQGA